MTDKALLPKNKHDLTALHHLTNLDDNVLTELAPELITWTQDINWPIALPLINFIAIRETCFLPSLIAIFQGHDLDWQETLLIYLRPKLTPETIIKLEPFLNPLFETHQDYFKENDITL